MSQQQPSEIDAVAALPGEPHSVSAAGVTRAISRLPTIETGSPFTESKQLRAVLVADDARAGRAAVEAVRWFKTQAPRQVRDRWSLSAVLLGAPGDAVPARRLQFPPADGFFDHPEEPESRYAWRWVTYQAPDLVVQMRGGDVLSRGTPPSGSLAAAIAGGSEMGSAAVVFGTVRETDGPSLLQQALADAPGSRSELRQTIAARAAREPLAIARVLAGRYPQNPIISYIPSVAWANRLRLADTTGDAAVREKVVAETRPWTSGERPLFGERIPLTAVAGTLIFAELAARGEDAARALAVRGADEALKTAPSGFAEHGQGWTDDMFMMSAILSRSGRMPGRAGDFDHLGKMLMSYAGRLQRQDGIFVHFTGRIPWGRGNGFASLGLTEALTSMPAAHPLRAQLLDGYRRYVNGKIAMHAPDGMWRQVVDEPGAYREESVTAMTLTSMARGIRLGWIDARTYRPVVDRAWRGLAAHITGEGGIVDICTSTGSQATLRLYLDRAAISGFDDRGGAMGLLASMEMSELMAGP
jgi:rhamnogalacturonyl hydrolase YesR